MSKLIACIVPFLLIACSGDGHLRGDVEPSTDGLTYFVLADDSNGTCASVLLDKKPWPHKIGQQGRVEPGVHEIDCNGATISFEIPEGTIFKFDYWGP